VRLISVGRLVEKKGFEYAIKAVASILDTCSNISYMIVGDGPLKNTLQDLIDYLHLSNRVSILGPRNQEEILSLLPQSDILLAPSINSRDGDQEGIPVAIMEAMATGLPVLTTTHAGIPELVKDGICGFVVKQGDVDMLAKRLHQLVASPELRTTLGNAARNIVKTNFDVDMLNDRLVRLFSHILRDQFQPINKAFKDGSI
jgi:colanic acid/amylovoran biosynthesis glycosyltransferase